MRIAWLGPVGEGGGVPSMGTLLLTNVLQQGVSVEYFTTEAIEQLPLSLRRCEKLKAVRTPSRWRWGRWYSSTPMLSFLSGSIARARAYNRMAKTLVERHRVQPFDCIFQFSQAELFNLARHLNELPPLIVYPCVHAAGELRWHRRESAYARQSENAFMHYLVRLVLIVRTVLQRRAYRKPAMVLGMSQRFNDLAAADYGLDATSMHVLYHPIEPRPASNFGETDLLRTSIRPLKLLYVSRISVRKGLEQIVELSRRLNDLQGKVFIDVIGDRTTWSDYTGHLKELNPGVARYVGSRKHDEMSRAYDAADILLVPSMYEPGGLVVGEALAHGMCVVASDEVGSAEPVAQICCRKFPAGDLDAFERCVRMLIKDLSDRGDDLRRTAALEATRHFEPAGIATRLIEHLRLAICAESSELAVKSPQPAGVLSQAAQ